MTESENLQKQVKGKIIAFHVFNTLSLMFAKRKDDEEAKQRTKESAEEMDKMAAEFADEIIAMVMEVKTQKEAA